MEVAPLIAAEVFGAPQSKILHYELDCFCQEPIPCKLTNQHIDQSQLGRNPEKPETQYEHIPDYRNEGEQR